MRTSSPAGSAAGTVVVGGAVVGGRVVVGTTAVVVVGAAVVVGVVVGVVVVALETVGATSGVDVPAQAARRRRRATRGRQTRFTELSVSTDGLVRKAHGLILRKRGAVHGGN
jgi:hypothetical protein